MAKGVGGKRKLKFSTTEDKKKKNKIIGIVIFSLVVLVLILASVVTYSREHPKTKKPTPDDSNVDVKNTQIKKEATILFGGVKTKTKEIVFLSYITLNTENKTFYVGCVPATESFEGKSFSEIYNPDPSKSTKPEEVMDAVSKKYDVDIDRYVFVTEKNFKKFVGELGLYEVDLKTKIDYEGSDFTLHLLKGPQKLTAENFFKYIRFMGLSNSSHDLERQAEVIADFVSQKVSEKNIEKGEELFSELINVSQSNITIVDYTNYKDFLNEIAKEPRNVKTLNPVAVE